MGTLVSVNLTTGAYKNKNNLEDGATLVTAPVRVAEESTYQ
jgi:hypothetical protein